jgi:hypothetical protein
MKITVFCFHRSLSEPGGRQVKAEREEWPNGRRENKLSAAQRSTRSCTRTAQPADESPRLKRPSTVALRLELWLRNKAAMATLCVKQDGPNARTEDLAQGKRPS